MKNPRRTFRNLSLIVLAVGGGVLWSVSPFANAGRKLENELVTLRKYGLPTTPDELRAEINARTGTNGAKFYRAAFKECNSVSKFWINGLSKVVVSGRSGKLTPSDETLVAGADKELASAFSLFEKAGASDRLDMGRNWEQGPYVLFPDLAANRRMTHFAALIGMYRIEKGDYAGGERLLVAAAQACRHLGEDPMTISAILRARNEADVIAYTLRALEKRPNDPRVLRIAERVLSELGPVVDLRSAVKGDIVTALLIDAEVGKRGVEPLLADFGVQQDRISRWDTYGSKLQAFRRQSEFDILRMWRKFYEDLPSNPEDTDRVTSAMKGMDAAETGVIDAMRSYKEMLVNFMDQNAVPRALASRRVLSAALSFVQGQDHASLPRDPMGSGPLKSSAKAIYSLGDDRKDDKGDAAKDISFAKP